MDSKRSPAPPPPVAPARRDPLQCILCAYRATDKASFRVHQRRHTGEKPYACDVCGVTYGYLATRNRHRLTSHGSAPLPAKARSAPLPSSTALAPLSLPARRLPPPPCAAQHARICTVQPRERFEARVRDASLPAAAVAARSNDAV